MRVVIVGGGIAGLAAAWRLKSEGVPYVVIDRNADLGGRCRTFQWNERWVIRGAAAFITSERNLIDQAEALGVYAPERIRDMTAAHSFDIPQRGRLHTLRNFAPPDILASSLIPLAEKVALTAALPTLIGQFARGASKGPTSAVEIDTVSACAYFRKYSPAFVDYILEPIMNMFCGYGEDDYSLAWLIWMMAGRDVWANAWWSFAERGVGQLTQSLEAALRAHAPDSVLPGSTARAIRKQGDGSFHVGVETPSGARTIEGDAVILAVPGSQVQALGLDLDDAHHAFFDQVSYVGHHIVYARLRPPGAFKTTHVALPTAEGYTVLSNASVEPDGEGGAWFYGEIKGAACARLGASDGDVMAAALDELYRWSPELAGSAVVDSYVQRNDIALCRRHVGYTRALAHFDTLRHPDRIAFAGDYLLNSTVGSAHSTGVQAADRIISAIKVAG